MTTAAATLHLKIDTGTAAADLLNLKNEYSSLKAALGTDLKAGGFSGLSDELKKARSDIAQLTAAAATSAKAYEVLENKLKDVANQSKGAATSAEYLMQVQLRSAEMTGNAIIKATTDIARAKNQANNLELKVISAEETAKVRDASKAANELARAKNLANNLELRVIAAEEAGKIKEAAKATAELARAKNLANNLELKVISAEQSAALNKAKKDAEDLAKWLSLSDKERAFSTVRAARSYFGGADQSALPGASGSAQALAAAKLAGGVKAAETTLANLSTTTRASTGHQVHWNKVANEGHAAARGLSGALGGLWMTYGSIAPLLAGAALAGSMKQVFTVGKELEYQFTYIKAITGGVAVSFDDFSKAVQGAMFTPVEAAGGLRVLAQAGLSAKDAMAALPSVLKLATVGEVDLAGAALSATSIMHTFGKSVEDISHIGDVFSKAAALSATSVKEMMEAMKQAASISNVYGVSLEETAAALGTLANRGIEGSAAGTAIRNMVKELSSPATQKAAYAMEQYGIQIFKADGSVKTFSENLSQLSDVTRQMSAQSKARFLEDLFNERGAKAANILLSDLDKMNNMLKEIQMSSKGLGFMTEAQMELSQSTKGMLTAIGSSVQLTLGKVYESVEPQIKLIVSSIADFVKRPEFKAALETIARGVTDLTKFLIEHGQTIATVVAAYAGFKVLTVVGSAILSATGHLAAFTGAMGPAVSGVAAFSTILAGPLAIGLAAAALLLYANAMRTKEFDEAQQKTVESATNLTSAQGRLNDAIGNGIATLAESNKNMERRIQLMREGKTAAEAEAQALDSRAYSSAKSNVADIQARHTQAKAHLNSKQFEGEDINRNASAGYVQAINAESALRKELEESRQQLVTAATNDIRAGMEGRQKEHLDKRAKVYADVELQNRRLEAYKEIGAKAQDALDKNDFYGSKDSIALQKKTLQGKADRGNAVNGWSALDQAKSETKDVQAEYAKRDAWFAENTLDYSRKGKPAKPTGGSSTPKLPKDWQTQEERSALELLKEAQKEQLDVLQSSQKHKLISEEQYQSDSEAIYAKHYPNIIKEYEESLKRLEAIANKGNGAEAERAQTQYNVLKKDHLKYIAERKMRLLDSNNKELQIEKEFREKSAGILAQAQAEADAISAKAQAANLKLDKNPAQVAAYDAGVAFDDKFRKQMADMESEAEKIDHTTEQYRKQIAVIDELKLAMAGKKAIVETNAAAAMEESRSFEAGWKRASRAYMDDAENAAGAAERMFNTASKSMEDALVQFATTGKLSFKGLAESIIADIARTQAKAAVSGLMGMLSKAVGSYFSPGGSEAAISRGDSAVYGPPTGGESVGLSSFPSSVNTSFEPPVISAKGNSFGLDGLHAFAKGGAFTNQIVSSPTFFKFANGGGFSTGVMGEAGDEAVVPLARDSAGRLGVRSQGGNQGGGNMSVEINNYGSDKITQREVQDGRGNRSLQIQIGEAVSAEMQRSGSSVNKAMKQPQMVRR